MNEKLEIWLACPFLGIKQVELLPEIARKFGERFEKFIAVRPLFQCVVSQERHHGNAFFDDNLKWEVILPHDHTVAKLWFNFGKRIFLYSYDTILTVFEDASQISMREMAA